MASLRGREKDTHPTKKDTMAITRYKIEATSMSAGIAWKTPEPGSSRLTRLPNSMPGD
jgi:hypothetical protein